jgi:putative DNA primase/helicase
VEDDWRVIHPVPSDAPKKIPPHPLGKPSAKWSYRDRDGRLLFIVCRFDTDAGKQIIPLTYGEDGIGRRWRWKGFPAPRPLYGLDKLASSPDTPVLVCEGEKAVDAAAKIFTDYVVTTSSNGAKAPGKADWTVLSGRQVVVWPDNDREGSEYAQAVAGLCDKAEAASVAIVDVSQEFPDKWDLADSLPQGQSIAGLNALLNSAKPWEAKDERLLRAINIADFLNMKIPPREMLLDPILPSQGLAMLYAKRGVGKTYVALSIAYAVATGSSFLRWQAIEPRRVLYLDGEMPAGAMQERFAQIVQAQDLGPPDEDYLRIITSDLQEDGFPDLSSADGQEAIEEHLDDVSLVIVDNLSTLCRSGRENEAESWTLMQNWLISLRRRGIAVLLVHHAGKGGDQRGTSRREDCLDTVIRLERPEDYRAEEGARFEVHLDKARAVFGDDAKPFEAKLEVRDGAAIWTTCHVVDRDLETVMKMTEEGCSTRDIEKATGISKTTVNRLQHRARDEAD